MCAGKLMIFYQLVRRFNETYSARLLTEAFKREAVKLVAKQQLNIAAAGRQLDVDPKSIRAWMGHAKPGELKATLGASKLTADQQRIRELERELAITKLERDILNQVVLH